METLNSSIRLDLPVSPNSQQPAQFNELLTAYGGLRLIHSAISQILVEVNEPPEVYDPDKIIALYLNSSRAKLILQAGADIQAGRFLETYLDAGRLKVRHTRARTDQAGTSWHCIGLSLEDVSAGNFATVYVEPAIIPGFSGLDAGRPYFAYDDGQFVVTNTPAAVGTGTLVFVKQCCTAITPTAVRLCSFWPPR